MASSFLNQPGEWELFIPEVIEIDCITFYKINVKIGVVKWTVQRRYTDFSDLHKTLVLNHGVSKETLPRKLFCILRNDKFIESRRLGLQKYINDVLRYLSNTMPPVLVSFLEMDKYDLWFLLKDLSNRIKMNGWIENPPIACEISIIEMLHFAPKTPATTGLQGQVEPLSRNRITGETKEKMMKR